MRTTRPAFRWSAPRKVANRESVETRLRAAAGAGQRVALVAGRQPAGTTVSLPRLELDPSDASSCARLASLGPWSALVDCGDAVGLPARFAEGFPLLRLGGAYLAYGAERAAVLRRLVAGLPAENAVEVEELADGVAVVQGRQLLAVMRENEMNVALAADPIRGRILSSVPAATFAARSTTRENIDSGVRKKDVYHAPELFVREYRKVVCRTKSVVTQRGLVLPDTYRHLLAKQLQHQQLVNAGNRHVVAPVRRAVPLEGSFFHLDNEHRGFFGHALTEQVAKLWGWEVARAHDPDVRVLVSTNRGRQVAEWERVLLRAAGVPEDRLHVIEGPVRVDRLFAATPMFSMPVYVHPAIVHTWDRIGAALRDQAGPGPWPRRIFCSRRGDKRECANRQDVETFFDERGFTVIYPEDHSLADQAMLFHQADVVAGFKGSQMFTVMFTDRPKHLVLLGPSTYRASNEYMIAAIRGHRITGVTSKPHVPRSAAASTKEAFRSGFTFDFRREGVWLEGALERFE